MKRIIRFIGLLLMFSKLFSSDQPTRHAVSFVIGNSDRSLGAQYALDFGRTGIYAGFSKGSYFSGQMQHSKTSIGLIKFKDPREDFAQLLFTGGVAFHSYTNKEMTSVKIAKLPVTFEIGLGVVLNKRFVVRCVFDPVVVDGAFIVGINLNIK